MKKFLLIACSLALMAAPAWGADAPIFPGTIRSQLTTFVEGTDVAGTYKTIYTGGVNGSKVLSVTVSSTDTTAQHLVNLQYSDSISDHCVTATTCAPLQAFTTQLGGGFSDDVEATSFLGAVNGLPQDSDGNNYIFLKDETDTLEITFATALTASTKITVLVTAVDF
jgi:hypothetical protein